MSRAVIFDLDGLLAPTEELHSLAWRETFRAHGVHLSEAEYADHWIRAGGNHKEFLTKRELNLDSEMLLLSKDRRFSELLDTGLKPFPGVNRLLSELSGKTKIGLASASRRQSVEAVLKHLGISSHFDFTVAYQDVSRRKPYPDAFLLVASHFGVEPQACVVLEDSEKGVLAAYHAGMKCVAVPNSQTQNHDFSKATLVVSSLEELTWKRIQDLSALD